jgi:hypothetical protein
VVWKPKNAGFSAKSTAEGAPAQSAKAKIDQDVADLTDLGFPAFNRFSSDYPHSAPSSNAH